MKKTIVYHAKKHLSLITCMLVVSGVILIGVCVYLVVAPAKGVGPTTVSRTAPIPPSVVSSRYSIDYPVFHDRKVDTLLKTYASSQVAQFVNQLNEAKYDPRNRMTLDYSMLHHGSQFASVAFTQREYTVNNPVIVARTTMTFDLKKQAKLSINDLFVSESEAQLFIGTLLYDYFKQYAASEFTQAQFSKLLDFKLADIHDFAISGETITLYVNPKQLGSNRDLQPIAVKRSLLAKIMKPEYSKADAGKDVPIAATYVISEQPRSANIIDPNQKMIAITFDDGPGNYTNRVLDVLRRNRAHGTFFMIGRQVPGQADIVKRVANEGNEIGNHSWDHANLPLLSHDQLKQQVDETQRAVQNAADGYTPVLMRPPYGAIDDNVANYLKSRELKPALWNVDTEDWLYRDAQMMYDRIMHSAHDGSVILLHDIHPTSIEAVERAIPVLVEQGYQLVTMSQLEQYR